MQQNPEALHILDNSEILWQTLELARNLAMIQEIMQIQQPVQNLGQPLNPQSHVDVETVPDGVSALGQNYAEFNDQMLNSVQDPFGGNPFTALLEGQVLEQAQSSPHLHHHSTNSKTISHSSLQPKSSIVVLRVYPPSPRPALPPTG